MLDQSPVLTVSDRVYALLLLAYPSRFRRDYGREMAQVFRDDARGTFLDGGAAGLISLWFLVLFDLLKTAIAEHVWEVFHMPLEKLERWSGLLAAVGGAFSVYLMISYSGRATSDQYVLAAVLTMGTFVLWAIALGGLYRRLPETPGSDNKVAFSTVVVAVLLSAIGFVTLPFTDSAFEILLIGYFGIGLGIVLMGIVAMRHRALGGLSFVPLLIAAGWLGFVISFLQDFSVDGPLQLAFALLLGVGWFLLGIGLWTTERDSPGPALPT